ncbi:MAG: FAD-dependent oxidoreductase [Succinivibrio sp.]|nr:FAD-dependent oxidoreductase [Succinivibrio sp.]
MKVIVIGGGAAGASCAARIRRNDEQAEVEIFEKTDEISIANCGLPYYIGQVITSEDDMHVSSVDMFENLFNIKVRLNTQVTEIKTAEHSVVTADGTTHSYDRLVITTGAQPFVPDLKGMEKDRTFTLRNLADANRIKEYIKNNGVKRAVVVGGGFIGVEMAENLAELNIDTTIVELAPHIMANVDEDIAKVAQNRLKKQGIKLVLSDGVKEFDSGKLILNSGSTLEYDLVVLSIGVRPQIEIAKAAGLATGRGIIVNENMQTSDKDIFAAGDNVEVTDFSTGAKVLIPLAGPANRQGRIIADVITGKNSVYGATQGSSVVKIADLTLASVGSSEEKLKKLGKDYLKTVIFGRSHASYYPASKDILYKLLFSKNGEILGAQAIGEEGVEKRIDVIATVMRLKGTVQDLLDAELCYAPPFNSAKDAVNVLGMNAVNILDGRVKMAFLEDLKDSFLIDVRPPMMFSSGTIEGAINIPAAKLRESLDRIPHDKKVVLFCKTGYTSYVAARILMQNGFDNVYSFGGGIMYYNQTR